MVQNDHLQFNSEAIEALKAATRQVVESAPRNENPGSPTMTSPVADTARGEPKQKLQSMPASENFAEAFMRKITSVEQEQPVVEQELDRIEKLQSDLTEKKQQLENRRNELTKVEDKLKELDKEMSDVLKTRKGWGILKNYASTDNIKYK